MKFLTLPFLGKTKTELEVPGEPDLVVRRSRQAKRLLLRVDQRTGAAVLTLPTRVPLADGYAFVTKNKAWLERARAALPPSADLTPGTKLPILGEDILLIHNTEIGRKPLFDATAKTLTVGGAASEFTNRVRRFLRQYAADYITPKAQGFAASVNRPIAHIRIGDQKSRWGSCTSDGVLSFSWRLICAPSFVIDYVIAHEVAHRVEMNHSARFWAVVHQIYGKHDRPRAWLKQYGPALQRIG